MIKLTNEYQKLGEVAIGNAGYGNYLFRLYARYNKQYTDDNASSAQVELRHYTPQGYITYYSSSQELTGDIKKTTSNSTNKQFTAGETVLLTETTPIEHEEDGSKTISIGARFTNSYFGNTVKIDPIEVELPKIDRPNEIAINNGEVFSVDTKENISNEIPVTITKHVDSYTSKLKITMENNLGEQTIIRDYTSFDDDILSFTTSELQTIYNNTPKFKLLALIFDFDSYDGDTLIGTYTVRQSASLSEEELFPSFTVEFTETNPKVVNLMGTSANTIVQNASKVNVEVSPIAHKGATIDKVQLMHNNLLIEKTVSPYNYLFDVVNSVFDFNVIDSRENNTPQKYTKSIIEYIPIEILSFSFKRENPTSSNVMLNAQIRYKQTTFNNTSNTPTIKWKKGESSTFNTLSSSDYAIDAANNLITISNLKLEDAISYKYQDIFYLSVNDLLTDDAENELVLKGIPVVDYGEHDVQVNGDLFLADENRQNKVSVATMNDIKDFITFDDIEETWQDLTLTDAGKVILTVHTFKTNGKRVILDVNIYPKSTINAGDTLDILTIPVAYQPRNIVVAYTFSGTKTGAMWIERNTNVVRLRNQVGGWTTSNGLNISLTWDLI